MLMIDWVTSSIKSSNHIFEGFGETIQRYDRLTGEIKSEYPIYTSFEEPTWSGKMSAKSNLDGTQFFVSGNPAKFLNGHNVSGSCDLPYLVAETESKLIELEPNIPLVDDSPLDHRKPMLHNSELMRIYHRVDLTRSARFDSEKELTEWLINFSNTAYTRHKAKVQTYGTLVQPGTVMIGKGSEHWSAKFYRKFQEVEKNPPKNIGYKKLQEILEYSNGLLRVEFTLRSKYLEDCIYMPDEDIGYGTRMRRTHEDWMPVFKDLYSRISWTDRKSVV